MEVPTLGKEFDEDPADLITLHLGNALTSRGQTAAMDCTDVGAAGPPPTATCTYSMAGQCLGVNGFRRPIRSVRRSMNTGGDAFPAAWPRSREKPHFVRDRRLTMSGLAGADAMTRTTAGKCARRLSTVPNCQKQPLESPSSESQR